MANRWGNSGNRQTLFFWAPKSLQMVIAAMKLRCLLLGRKVMTNLDSIFGEGNGNPLQCSCLENPRGGGAWWAASVESHSFGHNWSDLAADSILKSRDMTLPTKVCLVKARVFPVVMYGCESWTVKKAERWRIDAFELWCWRRLLRVPWTARRSNQLKEISLIS